MKKLEKDQIEALIDKAISMMDYSYVPYSHFHVGAALLAKNGNVYGGCNIENASYPCGLCAERAAAAQAISAGNRAFAVLAVAGSGEEVCTPCGLCRQFLFEFAPNLRVLCANRSGAFEEHTLQELLRAGFGGGSMS